MSDDHLHHQKTEFDDLQRELSGADGMKTARFLDEQSAPRKRNKKDKDTIAEAILRSELQKRLDDPEYAAAWNRANDAVAQLLDKVTTMADALAQRIEHLEDVVDDLEANTATTEDGALVFRDPQGRLCDASGKPLSAEDAANVQDPENAQSYEQYRNAQDALRKAREKQDRLDDIRRDAQRWKDRLNDPENPMDKDELEDIIRHAQDADTEIKLQSQATPEFGKASSERVDSMMMSPEISVSTAAP